MKEEKEQVLDSINTYLIPILNDDNITTHEMLKVLIAKAKHLIITDF